MEPASNARHVIFRLLGYARSSRLHLCVAGLLTGAAGLLYLACPWVARDMLDVSGPLSFSRGLAKGAQLLGMFALLAVLNYLQTIASTYSSERTTANLRAAVFHHLTGLDAEFYARHQTGELSSRLMSDTSVAAAIPTEHVLTAGRLILTVVVGLAIMSVLSWHLTLLMLVSTPLFSYGVHLYSRHAREGQRGVQESMGALNALAHEVMSGIRVTQLFCQEPHEVERYRTSACDVVRKSVEVARQRSIFQHTALLLARCNMLLVLCCGSLMVSAHFLSPGGLISILMYTVAVAEAVTALISQLGQMHNALGAAARVFEVLDRQPAVREPTVTIPLEAVRGHIELEGVTFAYPDDRDTDVLSNVRMQAHPGEVVAIVGRSGAGKSTLLSLLCRFYDPTHGTVRLDGHDVRAVSLSTLRQNIGVVPQEPFLFSGSIRDNIAYGRLHATDEEIEEAARAVHAHDFIRAFPHGYATIVGERGVKLSGGQRQRIILARTLLKNPRILILDEATNALDAASEELVTLGFEALMGGRTTIIVAHRLSTIRRADRIVVLDAGRVVQSGGHEELMARGGLYRDMVQAQDLLPHACAS